MTPLGAIPESSSVTPVRLAFRDTALGVALIGSSRAGVRTIFIGDERSALLTEWKACNPGAHALTEESGTDPWADAVAAWLDAPGSDLSVPLDIAGTQFQRAVWSALCEIPFGTTSTYAKIAQQIGRPRAVRAVAGACAMNSLAVAIPCHRVLRSDGDVSGYRWGVDRKRRLIAREASPPV